MTTLPTGTVTFLFTDVKGSTAAWIQDPRTMSVALARHDALIEELVAAHAGQVVRPRGEGDSRFAVFARASDAVAAACAVQIALLQEPWPLREPLRVRIAVHTGEADLRLGDYYGPAVNHCARLRAAAHAGQVLISAVTSDLVRESLAPELTVRDLGEYELKDLERSEHIWQVVHPLLPAEFPPLTAVSPTRSADDASEDPDRDTTSRLTHARQLSRKPKPLDFARPSSVLVGRERELGVLLQALDAAALRQGTVTLVSGEPGIGKTRLLVELATSALARGWRVLLGRAYETDGPPYLPFVEALRGHLLTCPVSEAQALRARIPPSVERLIPGLVNSKDAHREPKLRSRPGLDGQDPETERYQLFEAVCDLLFDIARSAAPQGLLLVLDDLHWADASTLQLLLHLMHRLAGWPVIVVGSHRNIALQQTASFAEFLADFSREHVARRLTLLPLARDHMSALVSVLSGISPAPVVVDAVFHHTRGNPFFVGEVVRHLREQGRDVADPMVAGEDWSVPDGVQQIIVKRLSRLSELARQVLQASAVLGEPFGFSMVEAMLSNDTATLLEALEEILAAGLVREEGQKYFFSHALVRQSIYDELSLPRRQRLHLQAGESLERLYTRSLRLHLGEIAMHYRLAGSAGDPIRALDYSERAADAAVAMLAYEEAARHWQAALALMGEADFDVDQRARILEQLGHLLFVAGLDYQRGIAYMDEALKLYESCGAAHESARLHCLLGHALSSIPETWNIPGSMAHFRAAQSVLEQTPETGALGDLYAGLAQAAVWSVDILNGLAWSQAAMDIALRQSDDRLWARAAVVHGAHLCSSGRLAEGFALMERAWSVGDRINDPVSFFITFVGSAFASWLGDPRAAQVWCERELGQRRVGQAHGQRRRFVSRLAAHYALGGDLDKARSLLAEVGPSYDAWPVLFWSGDWDRCETIAREQVDAGRQSGDRAFALEATYHLAELARVRGDRATARRLLEDVIEIPVSGGELTYELALRSSLALLLSEVGDTDAAGKHLARCQQIAGNGENWLGMLGRVWVAECAYAARRARMAEGALLMQRALDTFRRYNLPWAQAEVEYVWGRYLCAGGDAERGRQHLDHALEIYRRLGAGEAWIERVQRDPPVVTRSGRTVAPYPDGLSGREVEVLRLIASGRTNRQISAELSISVDTVARHISHIFDKTGAANRAEAASYAHQRHLA
ncbi:MAG: AAA family ATPase [Chloroflexi bacterium]|nr:AAA family ATPase [Chloroflexota bacterium]